MHVCHRSPCRYHDAFTDPSGHEREWSLGTRLNPATVPERMDAKVLREELLDEQRRAEVLVNSRGAQSQVWQTGL